MKHLLDGRGGSQPGALSENCQCRIPLRYHDPAMCTDPPDGHRPPLFIWCRFLSDISKAPTAPVRPRAGAVTSLEAQLVSVDHFRQELRAQFTGLDKHSGFN